jgi:phosphonate transport system substrate-binding protein
MTKYSRRNILALGGAAAFVPAIATYAQTPLRLGLTPVFLDNDALVIERLRAALTEALGVPVEMEQRRTYKEVTEMLLDGAIDAAWLCGYPYLQHKDALSLVAVPVWNGKPLYRSYLITSAEDEATSLDDLKGDVHAFSDPDSNSGFLVTASDLAQKGLRPEDFFGRTIFTYGHRNVVRAVSSGLVRSGSVDGYVWEALAATEPEMTVRTKVVSKSEWLGFPPICALTNRIQDADITAFGRAILSFDKSAKGRAALDLLQLDGMTFATPDLFDGIARRMKIYTSLL